MLIGLWGPWPESPDLKFMDSAAPGVRKGLGGHPVHILRTWQ